MSRTTKKEYHQRTNKFSSNRFSGYEHFRIKPFGLKGWVWGWQLMRDKLGNLRLGGPHEDVLSTINKSSQRMKDKIELKKEINSIENEKV